MRIMWASCMSHAMDKPGEGVHDGLKIKEKRSRVDHVISTSPEVQFLRIVPPLVDGREEIPPLSWTASPVGTRADVVGMEHTAGETLVEESRPSLCCPKNEKRGKGELLGESYAICVVCGVVNLSVQTL